MGLSFDLAVEELPDFILDRAYRAHQDPLSGRGWYNPALPQGTWDIFLEGRWRDLRPEEGFVKAFMHNGVFKSLKEVVHFYNARDVDDFPPPEVEENVNTEELGDLKLTDREEDLIVLFMKALSDGFQK